MPGTADLLIRWEFFQAPGDKWGWRRKGTDGYHAQCPQYFVGFGPVFSDAMNHGFSPAHDIWMVEDSNTVSYFSPGDRPRTLQK